MKGFEKKGLRRLFGPKRTEIIGDGRELYFEELHSIFSSLNIITKLRIE
jgi:hypothetical protein